jgi:hypothetical protein
MNKLSHIWILFIAFFILMVGCNDKKRVMEKPDNLINRITLVNILAESYLIESTLQVTPTDTVHKDELSRRYYKDLFDRYHITRDQFESSIAYYISEEKSAEKLLNDASAMIVNKKREIMIQDSVMNINIQNP